MCFLHLDFVCIFCFTAIFHYAFNAVWRWNIKYLSNPWTTSLSLFSLVWVSKTHMLTGGLLTKHFQGRRRGWYMSVKKKYIHLCMSAPPWHNGDFQERHEALSGPQKREPGSRRRCWRLCIPEKSGAAPSGSPSYLVYICLSEAVPASHYSSTVTNYLC